MKIKEGFVLEEVGGSYLAASVGSSSDNFAGLVRMNGTGAFLFKLMSEGDVTREELLKKVMEVYTDVSEQTALNDIIAFEKKLRDGGILE